MADHGWGSRSAGTDISVLAMAVACLGWQQATPARVAILHPIVTGYGKAVHVAGYSQM